jgi:hypothetical protein
MASRALGRLNSTEKPVSARRPFAVTQLTSTSSSVPTLLQRTGWQDEPSVAEVVT